MYHYKSKSSCIYRLRIFSSSCFQSFHLDTMSNDKLHIVVFPWLAFGHMLPYLDLSKSLAKRGHHISFISTPRNIQRLPKIPSEISHLLNFIPFSLPKVEGLPETVQATSDIPPESVEHLKKAFDGLEQPFRRFIEKHDPKPADWIIHDFAHHWVPRVAAEAGVPTIFLSIFSSVALAFIRHVPEADEVKNDAEQLMVSPTWVPFPTKVRFRPYGARRLLSYCGMVNASGWSDTSRLKVVVEGCNAVAIKSCTEVESEWLSLLPKIYSKPVIPVGLLPPAAPVEERGEDPNTDHIFKWLDEQRSKSVVYIAFGSETLLSIEVMHELALGIELAELPFIWALRDQTGSLPEGFEERTKHCGIVVKSWVPQVQVLAHGSIGASLTHSGWSTIIESLYFGRPLVLLPMYGDQGLNARVMMEKGAAIEIERDEENGSLTKEAVAKALRLVVKEEEGEPCRRKTEEMKQVIGNKECQENYVDEFIQYMQKNRLTRV